MAMLMTGAFISPRSYATLSAPASKLFVADLNGKADLNTADAVTALTKKSVFNAQGSSIVTNKESNDSMVYSNGSGIYLDADTRLEVQKIYAGALHAESL